jgi:hypothetical protein
VKSKSRFSACVRLNKSDPMLCVPKTLSELMPLHETRTHLALGKDAPVSRPVQRTGVIGSCAILGGLHHHYARA